jgi:hypothetical protein
VPFERRQVSQEPCNALRQIVDHALGARADRRDLRQHQRRGEQDAVLQDAEHRVELECDLRHESVRPPVSSKQIGGLPRTDDTKCNA